MSPWPSKVVVQGFNQFSTVYSSTLKGFVELDKFIQYKV